MHLLYQHAAKEASYVGNFWLQEGTERERETVVLWKISDRFFPVPCASGQPMEINKADSGIRGSGHRSGWLGCSRSRALTYVPARWKARHIGAGVLKRGSVRFPVRRFAWAFKQLHLPSGPLFPLECPSVAIWPADRACVRRALHLV